MRYFAYFGLGVLLLLAGFAIWVLTSVSRGARRRDRRILDVLEPLGRKLQRKEPVDVAEIRALAEMPHVRGMLHALLEHYAMRSAFPEGFNSRQHHAESMLVYWMMHPNELQDPPARLEPVESVPRRIGGRDAEFLVFRYQMAPGHWAGTDWLLGL